MKTVVYLVHLARGLQLNVLPIAHPSEHALGLGAILEYFATIRRGHRAHEVVYAQGGRWIIICRGRGMVGAVRVMEVGGRSGGHGRIRPRGRFIIHVPWNGHGVVME